MTRDKKRKAAVRETQKATGLRYTKAARLTSKPAGDRIGQSFTLQELLSECATFPPAAVDWGWGPEYKCQGPDVFQSKLLGAAIPFGTVLELAGELSREGRGTPLHLEALSPLESAVVSSGGQRRFKLIITQDSVYELCRQARCSYHPENELIPWCRDHLAECDPGVLVETARDWGYAQSEDAGRDPESREGSEGAAVLVRAAVAQGAYPRVVSVLLDACFEPDDMIDEVFWDPKDALAMRQAIDREQLRLGRIAEAEYRRIQKEAGACVACEKEFRYGIDMDVPARYCSPGCTPPPPAVAGPDPWWAASDSDADSD
ncbi:hypothetical protein [Streptomyces sp. ML-6]|uniref:hypothetical protein n=1 Tax=Streptomyces sp. ML-6 TaxID=2982693 RepID=UPI0024C06A25|nr:hypothetical protein [Streptomyces sp. ML-6]MDK0525097.1 hypothetical protein [Streptomyces sp. ML-6]